MARKRRPGPVPPESRDPAHVRLRRLVDRKRGDRTDAEIAELAGMTRAAFSRLLSGTITDPRLSTIQQVLDAIGATLRDFDKA